MAEWVDNNIYKECEIDHLGNTLCLAYDRGTGQMYASNGLNGNPLDASKTGLAPFFLLLWGDFQNRVDGFEEHLSEVCCRNRHYPKSQVRLCFGWYCV